MSLFEGVFGIVLNLHRSAARGTVQRDTDAEQASAVQPQTGEPWVPALNPSDSISADGRTIYCLVDGAPLNMLQRYIRRWGFTPDSYRQAFGLPGNYPMVAPGYSALKREKALKIGLGTRENRAGRKAERK